MAQQPVMPVIGFLHAGSLDGFANHVVAFRQGLNEAGFIPNQNVAIEYRWAAGQYDRLPALASELTGRQVAVLVASETGLVASLRRPEGNVTGVSFASRALAVKRLELIRELLPQATAIAVLENSQNPIRPEEMAELNSAAAALGQQLHLLWPAPSPRSIKLLLSLARSGLTPLCSMAICFSPANATSSSL
jgi:putative ABC transport system substrate-binding protein